jgi:opacity protein-like surface antigen
MKKLLAATTLIIVAASAAHSAGADDTVRESRSIDANVSKIRLGGAIHLVLHQGATPSLVLSGEREDLARVTTVQRGDTLTFDTRGSVHWIGHHDELRADLTLPNLQELVSQGVGASEISGFSGDRVTLSETGAGAINFAGQYKNVDATLGGVGSMTLNPGQAERIDLKMTGAGSVNIAGQTNVLRAHLGGVGSLDAQKLQAQNVELDMTGMGSASVTAKSAANVHLSGMGSATVYGKPATRNATSNGFGKVNWE